MLKISLEKMNVILLPDLIIALSSNLQLDF